MKLLLNFLLIYAIITVVTAILILWRAKKDRDIVLIIAGSSAVAILLFYLFYFQQPPLSETPAGTPPTKPTQLTKPETPEEHRSDRESEIKGPFPTDETVPEKERQIGRLFNLWRKAVLTRNIGQINQLDSQINGCGDEAVPFLKKLAREDTNERIRAFAVRILGRRNLADLSGLFMELLKDDQSAFVRENCCWSLGRLGNPDALETLQKTADSDPSEPVRKTAVEAIQNIKSSK